MRSKADGWRGKGGRALAISSLLTGLLTARVAAAETAGPAPVPVPGRIALVSSPFVFGAGGIGSSMDAVPFFEAGVWHLFHMQTRPQGIAHRVSRDLINWEIRPVAIPGDAAPGNVVVHRGRYYLFYTVNQTVHVATSEDLDRWTPVAKNPVATVDGQHYVGPNFRDPYVFYVEDEACWWMILAAEVPGPLRFRAGCVGLYKSRDLLDWQAAPPLWAPGHGPRHECPQVIRHRGRWYLFDLQRQDQYRVAKSLAGPWQRPPSPYLGPHTALTGSHVASDGTRWVSFPFLCALRGQDDFGDVVQAEVYAIPRQLDFHRDGAITERPVVELTDALRALHGPQPLAQAVPVSGRWQVQSESACASSLGSSGTLRLDGLPANLYLETDLTLGTRNMEASFLLRTDAELTRGYRLTLHPRERLVSLRPFSYWDRDRVLLERPCAVPVRRPFKVRIFLSGTVVEAFIDDRVALSTRVYRHADGGVAFEAVDGTARFDRLRVRSLAP